jgi:hypothetical protein
MTLGRIAEDGHHWTPAAALDQSSERASERVGDGERFLARAPEWTPTLQVSCTSEPSQNSKIRGCRLVRISAQRGLFLVSEQLVARRKTATTAAKSALMFPLC